MLKQLFSAAALVALAGSPALAAEVTEATPVNAAPEKVWATIGGFCGIGTWHPAVEACALSTQGGKNIRTLSLKGGGTIVEEEVGRDDARMAYSYRILESPLPVANYVSTIQVEPSGSAGSKVTWTGSFEPKGASEAEAKAVIDGIYVKGLAAIVDKST
ncbi:SRPBCC family protein [Hansschlegelia sp.]|uniref:SRPBCC family protein n=1 Tax=Hansschlegelia sp. TaxID=2041892 RepID=UPI002D1177DA|nr:SRPBCC family protein [Hansschlegelia sp.]HVI29856.1 SRPBCC family protein [Hansschlegelia sp.]